MPEAASVRGGLRPSRKERRSSRAFGGNNGTVLYRHRRCERRHLTGGLPSRPRPVGLGSRPFFMLFGAIAFAGHTGTSLASFDLLRPRQVRMVLAPPAEIKADGTVGVDHETR